MLKDISKSIYSTKNNHIYLSATSESVVDFVEIQGNSMLNANSCTFDRTKTGWINYFPFYFKDVDSRILRFCGNRLIYDSKSYPHPTFEFKNNYIGGGGLWNIIPNDASNKKRLQITVKINENSLDSATDIVELRFNSFSTKLSDLAPGIYSYEMNITNEANKFIQNSSNRGDFWYMKFNNEKSEDKKFDFEFVDVRWVINRANKTSFVDPFFNCSLQSISIQDGLISNQDNHILTVDDAYRFNLINKTIDKLQRILE